MHRLKGHGNSGQAPFPATLQRRAVGEPNPNKKGKRARCPHNSELAPETADLAEAPQPGSSTVRTPFTTWNRLPCIGAGRAHAIAPPSTPPSSSQAKRDLGVRPIGPAEYLPGAFTAILGRFPLHENEATERR